MLHMSYSTAATWGLGAGLLRQVKHPFRDADTAWVGLTDFGYGLSILGDGVWGVDMADLVRRSQSALESLQSF